MFDVTDETEAEWFLLRSGSFTYALCVHEADLTLLGFAEIESFLSGMV